PFLARSGSEGAAGSLRYHVLIFEMKTAATPTLSSAQAEKPTRRMGLLFAIPPVLICLVALVLRIYVGSKQYMDFDEWQQVFMSAAPRWKDFTFEVNAEAHPPLFFLLLRWLVALGHSKLLYRSISIASGAGS